MRDNVILFFERLRFSLFCNYIVRIGVWTQARGGDLEARGLDPGPGGDPYPGSLPRSGLGTRPGPGMWTQVWAAFTGRPPSRHAAVDEEDHNVNTCIIKEGFQVTQRLCLDPVNGATRPTSG